MKNERYDYQTVIAVKILVYKNDKVLLLREPATNEWMPNRLSLPGGKLFLNETIEEGLKRKIQTEIGLEVELKGLVKVLDILMPEKNVFHLVFLAEHSGDGKIDEETEASEFYWMGAEEAESLTVDDFAEYYYPQLLGEYFDNKLTVSPTNIIQPQDNREGDVAAWMKKGV